jgi:hypothetical protein
MRVIAVVITKIMWLLCSIGNPFSFCLITLCILFYFFLQLDIHSFVDVLANLFFLKIRSSFILNRIKGTQIFVM